jgi:isochorismate hydrolase
MGGNQNTEYRNLKPEFQGGSMSENLDRYRLDREKAVLLVVDVQQKLIPSMDPAVYASILRNIDLLIKGTAELKIPVLATEQYSKGLGKTVPELSAACESIVVEKMTFGCCGEPEFLERLRDLGRSQVIVTGMEAHVCVYQTVLGLLEGGYGVHLVRDAIISRGKIDYLSALDNAARAGAVVTTAETVLFQLLYTAAAPEFKAVSGMIKSK